MTEVVNKIHENKSFQILYLKFNQIKQIYSNDDELCLKELIKAILNSNDETIQPVEIKKRCRGRPKTYEEGCKKHNQDTKYFLKYYYENKNKTTTCSLCGKENVKRLRLALHMKSQCCKNKQMRIELEELKQLQQQQNNINK